VWKVNYTVTFLIANNIKSPLIFTNVTHIEYIKQIGGHGKQILTGEEVQSHVFSTADTYNIFSGGDFLGVVDGWKVKIAAITVNKNPQT